MQNLVVLVKVYYVRSSLPSPMPLDESMFVFKIQCTPGKYFMASLLTFLLGTTSMVSGFYICLYYKDSSMHLFIHLST